MIEILDLKGKNKAKIIDMLLDEGNQLG